ncbi:GntR family transcriptional regulator [Pusillimonas sp.]|uniref:GntR family transcriptional regulator n=1 Tax=Pusillimonas sp. TaxID=3040095 RepID=UPI0029AA72B9|nr:GntR family transcriptional regulator [Pusillimonas sp.]MDX3896069.1 GntR family transcriptional regulator [Pusillimonas sp.]
MLRLDQRATRGSDIAAPKASSLLEGGLGGGEVDRVYADIFDAVMDRRLLPGAKLTEAALCEVFRCSRATVRAALAQLAHDKIVVLRPNRGAFVWRPSQAEMRDVFELRRDMECLLIDKLAALPDLAERLQPLRDMVGQERRAFECGDRISWLRLSNAFHVKLAQLAGNEVLTELMHSLCSRTTLIIAYRDTPGASTCSYIEHEQILDRLAAADRAGAREAMSHHLRDCEERMLESSSGRFDPWAAFSVKPEEHS